MYDDIEDDDMLEEYDFSNAVQGKHAGRITSRTVLVTLDEDVAKEFPTAESVNQALRLLAALRRQFAGVA